jgi:hypothetical protein
MTADSRIPASKVHLVAYAMREVHGSRAEVEVAAIERCCKDRGEAHAASQWQRVRRALGESLGPHFS